MNKGINCVITDDEPFARKGLQSYVERTDFLNLQGICEDALQLDILLKKQSVDLVFLDIQMPYLTGIEYLKTLRNPPKIIFTTAYEKYALEGFSLDVMDYLLKPITYERFLKAADKALDYFNLLRQDDGVSDYLFVKSNGRLEKVCYDEILFVKGLENYVSIFLKTGNIIVHTTLKALLEKLPEKLFVRTHKSFIVAIDKINIIEANALKINEHHVPIGRSLRDNLISRIKLE